MHFVKKIKYFIDNKVATYIFKRYKKDATSLFDPLHSLLGIDNSYMNQTATVELRGLMGADYFSYPKPVAFIKKLIFGCTNENDIVLDPFLGSGTTLISAVQNGRNCIGFEYNEGFKDLIIDRVSNETQKVKFSFNI